MSDERGREITVSKEEIPIEAEARVPAETKEKGCLGSAVALASVVVGTLYILNPTAGFIELIPDNIPIFGNLDEAAATTLLVLGLQYLFGKRK